jgi:Asp-tRNA(Asn)/Glu-tRNA(Gln) amidotransferase A subunit family amidase
MAGGNGRPAPDSVAPPAVPGRKDLEELLDRIDRREGDVLSLVPDETAAERRTRILGELKRLEQQWPDTASRPPLFGVVVGVKDLFHTADFPTRGGSQLPAEAFVRPGAPGTPGASADPGRSAASPPVRPGGPGSTPGPGAPTPGAPGDAAVVARLREAGAILLGKTVSTEFAYFAPGPTRNPLNGAHTPGGSSSGSAAAVAAGFCHFALGTQTIGSISRPASFCGVTGFKPSYGRVSAEGVIPFSPAADHVGVIAPDVATASRAAAVMVKDWNAGQADTAHVAAELSEAKRAKSAESGISAVPAGLRDLIRSEIGTVLVPDDAYVEQADDDGRGGLESAVERLSGLGVHITRVSIMDDIAAINEAHQNMIAREFAEIHRSWLEEFSDRYHKRSLQLVEQGKGVSDETYRSALAGRVTFRERLDAALHRHGASLWIAPATVGEAPEGIDATGNPIMNLPWTYAGVPTVALPVYHLPYGRGPAGLPLGIQMATPFGKDERLIYLASLIEGAFH